MRTFSYSDAKSHKFWTIDVQGTGFAVTYGKIGTAGQTAAKAFATAEKCQAEADKLVREKTGKGYVETTPKASVSDDEAFTKTLIARPDDRAAWSAYADYLSERGDPRGEFMAVQIALEDESLPKAERAALKKTEAALLKQHERDWLGPLAAFTIDYVRDAKAYSSDAQVTHTFRRGWVTGLNIPQLGVNLARALVRSPGLCFLQELSIITECCEFPAGPRVQEHADGTYEPGPDVPADADEQTAAYHALARFPHFASVRGFRLGGADRDKGEPFTDEDQCHTDGTFAHHLVKQMPNVERVVLRAHRVETAKLFALPMPELRVLVLDHLKRYPFDKLAENKTVTKLTHLIAHPHGTDYDADDDDGESGAMAYIRMKHLRAVCRAGWPLEFLRLRLTDFGDAGAKEIAVSGVLRSLRHLDLDSGCITEVGAAALAASPDLKGLKVLSLNSNAIHGVGVSVLKTAFPAVKLDSQHDQVPPFGDEIDYLSDGDME